MKQKIAFTLFALLIAATATAQITVVNMIPASRSGETNQDAEPGLSVNPSNPQQIAATAFTWDNLAGSPNVTDVAPTFYSTNGGLTWDMAMNIPSKIGAMNPTGDINLHFSASPSGTTSMLYAGILHSNDYDMWTLRCPDYRTNVVMTKIDTRTKNVDQPHVTAITSLHGDAGKDHLFVGFNNGWGMVSPDGHTASVVWTLDAVAASLGSMTLTPVEARDTGPPDQDGASNVVVAHPDGTVYAIFYGWRDWGAGGMGGAHAITDVVVVRDDKNGNDNFTDLKSGGVAGVQVVANQIMQWGGYMATNRISSSNTMIAVDPNNSSRVYIAWADQPGNVDTQTLHVRMSTDRGATWSPDLITVPDAINPGLAVNSHGTVAFVYQRLVGGLQWWTFFHRTTDAAGTVFDAGVKLSKADAGNPQPAGQPYLGDYLQLRAHGRDFYGIFSASNVPDMANFPLNVQYQRYADFATHTLYADPAKTMPVAVSIDPFFFHSVELAPSDDYYVRDWTDSVSSGDDGAEPSTHAKFYKTSDVWNRRGTLTGEPFPNDQPASEDAGNGMDIIGDNWAFARVRRNAAADAGSVTAHFVVSPFGTGSNFFDDSTYPGLDLSAPDPPALNFAAGELGPKITEAYHWHLDPIASTHLCLGVQIDSTLDHPLDPPLVGHAPGWGSGTDLMVLNDNNKAQRNLGLSTTPARGVGFIKVGSWALIHNAATFTRDMTLQYDPGRFGERAQIKVFGGDVRGNTIVLPRMRPGENRWIEILLPANAMSEGSWDAADVIELKNDQPVNGFAIGVRAGSMDQVVRDTLLNASSSFNRIGALYANKTAAKVADDFRSKDQKDFVTLVKSDLNQIAKVLDDLGGNDPFDTRQLLEDVRTAVKGGDAGAVAMTLTTLANALDSRTTMIELAKGNRADIPQTVRWEKDLLADARFARLECVPALLADGRAFEARNATWRDYPAFMSRATGCLAEAARVADVNVQPALEEIRSFPNDATHLQHAHASILNAMTP